MGVRAGGEFGASDGGDEDGAFGDGDAGAAVAAKCENGQFGDGDGRREGLGVGGEGEADGLPLARDEGDDAVVFGELGLAFSGRVRG